MLLEKAAGGGGITQASVPNVTVSSSGGRHFPLMLPAANIKTRAALTSLSSHNMLVNWPLNDSHGILTSTTSVDGRGRFASLILFFFSAFDSEKQWRKPPPHLINLAEKPTWQVIVSVRMQPCGTCIIISSRDWQSLLTGRRGEKPPVTRTRSCKEEGVVVVAAASSYFTSDLPKPVTQLWDTESGLQSQLWQAVSAIPTPVGHPSTRATVSSSPKAGHVRTSAVSSWPLGGKQKVKGRAARPDSGQEAGASRGSRGTRGRLRGLDLGSQRNIIATCHTLPLQRHPFSSRKQSGRKDVEA